MSFIAIFLTSLWIVKATSIEDVKLNYGKSTYEIRGFRPSGAPTVEYPLFVWLAGTSFDSWGLDAQALTAYVATQGVFAVSVAYDNKAFHYPIKCDGAIMGVEQFRQKADSIFNIKNADSAIKKLCDESHVNCQNIIVAGFSQGAQLASLAANYQDDTAKFRAVYEMSGGNRAFMGRTAACLNADQLKFAPAQIRSVSSENDEIFGGIKSNVMGQQQKITGSTGCSKNNCLQADGSGFYLVTKQEFSQSVSHEYAYLHPRIIYQQAFHPTYSDSPAGEEYPWAMQSSIQWLLGKIIKD